MADHRFLPEAHVQTKPSDPRSSRPAHARLPIYQTTSFVFDGADHTQACCVYVFIRRLATVDLTNSSPLTISGCVNFLILPSSFSRPIDPNTVVGPQSVELFESQACDSSTLGLANIQVVLDDECLKAESLTLSLRKRPL